jgi:hypothetical protein
MAYPLGNTVVQLDTIGQSLSGHTRLHSPLVLSFQTSITSAPPPTLYNLHIARPIRTRPLDAGKAVEAGEVRERAIPVLEQPNQLCDPRLMHRLLKILPRAVLQPLEQLGSCLWGGDMCWSGRLPCGEGPISWRRMWRCRMQGSGAPSGVP